MTNALKWILDMIQQMVNSYGWSVILFTVLIKGILLPLDVRSRKSMRAVTLLQPQLDALKKKYGNDQEKLNIKTNELYKKNKINPLSGCGLPMLIQLPILWCMFSAMRKAADEQQIVQMLTWVKTMTQPGADGTLTLMSLEQVKSSIDAGIISLTPTFDSWLWIKNVFQADSFMVSMMPTQASLMQSITKMGNELIANGKVTEADIALLKQFAGTTENGVTVGGELLSYFESIMGVNSNSIVLLSLLGFELRWPTSWTYVNGFLALPILAGVTQFIAAKFQQPGAAQQGTQTAQQGGMGGFMKVFFPLFSFWICLSSTAAFAIYWAFVNVFTIVTNYAINKYLEAQDQKKQLAEGGEQP